MEEVGKPGQEYESYKKRYDEFVSLAVHDLDSPLRKLGVFIEKLSDSLTPGSTDTSVYIKRINSCLQEMRSLVSSLSELDSIDSSKGYISCNIAAIVQDVLRDLAFVIKEKNATIEFTSLPVVLGDPEQYHLLFKKLLENSLKFSNPEVPLRINLYSEELKAGEQDEAGSGKNSNCYRIIIQDNGIGFTQEDAGKIFEPFNRLHGKSAYPGNGLGLAIAKRIVENHKGRIFAEGDEYAGSRFILIIPQNPK
jgi:signal transduction histidine kinase